jgi:NADPH:quinone reductase
MKQWQIQPDKTMLLVDAPIPEYGASELLIKVKAIGINRADLLQVKGLYPAPKPYDNRVPGLEYAGVVQAVGQHVSGFNVGDKVMGLVPSGAYSEYLAVHEREVLLMPNNMDFAQATSIPEAFLTSYRALFIEGQLQAGQYCLVRPATSAVGLAAIQLINAFHAIEIGSSRNLVNLHNAQQLGLQYCVTENESLLQQLQAITQPQGVALIMDMLGSEWANLLQCLKDEGRLVCVGVLAGSKAEVDVFYMLMHRLKIQAMTMRSQPIEQRIAIAHYFNQQLLPMFERGVLKALPSVCFAFEQVYEAHQHVKNDGFSGKRVLLLD